MCVCVCVHIALKNLGFFVVLKLCDLHCSLALNTMSAKIGKISYSPLLKLVGCLSVSLKHFHHASGLYFLLSLTWKYCIRDKFRFPGNAYVKFT